MKKLLFISSLVLSSASLLAQCNIAHYISHPPLSELHSATDAANKLSESVFIFLRPNINGKTFTISKSRGQSVIVTSLYRSYFESKIEHPEVLPLRSSVMGGLGVMNSTLNYQPGELGSTELTFTYEPADDQTLDKEKIKVRFTINVVE